MESEDVPYQSGTCVKGLSWNQVKQVLVKIGVMSFILLVYFFLLQWKAQFIDYKFGGLVAGTS